MKIPIYIQRYPLSVLWKLRGSIFRTLRHPRRLANMASYYFSFEGREPRAEHYPFFLTIELSGNCNLQCPMCGRSYRQSDRPGVMPLEPFKNLMEEAGDYLAFLLCFGYGESLLNPQAFDFIKEAKKRDIFTVMATNAGLLTPDKTEEMIESGLDMAVIGLDAITRDAYEKQRLGGDFDQVVRNIKYLIKKRDAMGRTTPVVDIQFLAFKEIEKSRDRLKPFVDELGADKHSIRKVASYGMNSPVWSRVRESLPPDDSEFFYTIYRRQPHGVPELNKSCGFPWRHLTINHDGTVIPCCKDVNGLHVLGNVFNGKFFREVWNGDAYRAFRTKMNRNIDGIDICRKCNKRSPERHFLR